MLCIYVMLWVSVVRVANLSSVRITHVRVLQQTHTWKKFWFYEGYTYNNKYWV